MAGKNPFSGYEGIYEWVRERLAGCDLAAGAPHLGLAAEPDGSVRVRFLARDYRVTRAGVEPADGRPVEVNHLSLVGHYAASPGRGEPSGEFLSLERLAGPMAGRQSLGGDRFLGPLHRAFAGNRTGLAAAAARLEGTPVDHPSAGGLAWLFFPFPKVAMQLVHHEADEEFPAEFRLLFDDAAPRFMEFEALGFLSGVFIRDLTARPEEGGV
jgi:hypothetical protein